MASSNQSNIPASLNSGVIVPAPPRPTGSPMAGIKHVIAVGSGKGGVGKSTTTVNLAFALSKLGAKVGLMDADIYGPSIPKLVGAREAPSEDHDRKKIIPPVVNGVKVMSMGLLGSEAPLVWRGPMASKAVTQFLADVDWGELDYLLIDLPPGTGDIQLTIAQAARLSGALVVMTPQGLAKDIAKRGLKMFQQVRIPVLGIVENMSEFECPECKHVSHIFHSGGGAEVAAELKLPLLASFPLDPILVDESDAGTPVVFARPDSRSAQKFLELAKGMAAELSSLLSGARNSSPTIVGMEPNHQVRMFKINWSDSKQSVVTFLDLRFQCPCANCVDEGTGVRKIKKEQIKSDVHPNQVTTVGNYAITVKWSDGHDTGIYSFDYLRKLLVV
jgi:ATP-binding protein involved in chromosome partitioning